MLGSSCKRVRASSGDEYAIYTVPMADATKIEPLNADEEAFLRALGRVVTGLPRVVDADMLEEHPISSTEYTVLVHLSEVPHNQMRMSELANVCGLSLSGMTRVVSRLESQSLVQRQRCPEDGRAYLAILTNSGWKMLRQAWPTNLASVRRHIFSRLEGCDVAAAAKVLERIAAP
jgi:DNA-binding MarR family transcriptional regulator